MMMTMMLLAFLEMAMMMMTSHAKRCTLLLISSVEWRVVKCFGIECRKKSTYPITPLLTWRLHNSFCFFRTLYYFSLLHAKLSYITYFRSRQHEISQPAFPLQFYLRQKSLGWIWFGFWITWKGWWNQRDICIRNKFPFLYFQPKKCYKKVFPYRSSHKSMWSNL